MATLPELQAMRAALERARLQPARSVQQGDNRIDYRTEAELAAAIAAADRAIADAQSPARPRSSRFVFQTSKGL